MNFLKNCLIRLISIVRYPKVFLFSKEIGKNIILGSNGRFIHPEEIYLGDNIYIAPGFHISARNLRIGNNVLIGPRLLMECDDHIFKNLGKTIWASKEKRNIGFITIEDDVWIGGNVTILKNVTIGEGCIIGAASVVTKSLPPYSICLGVPCHPYKLRFTEGELIKHLFLINSKYEIQKIINLWKNAGLI